jgi:hypothetical protein
VYDRPDHIHAAVQQEQQERERAEKDVEDDLEVQHLMAAHRNECWPRYGFW